MKQYIKRMNIKLLSLKKKSHLVFLHVTKPKNGVVEKVTLDSSARFSTKGCTDHNRSKNLFCS